MNLSIFLNLWLTQLILAKIRTDENYLDEVELREYLNNCYNENGTSVSDCTVKNISLKRFYLKYFSFVTRMQRLLAVKTTVFVGKQRLYQSQNILISAKKLSKV